MATINLLEDNFSFNKPINDEPLVQPKIEARTRVIRKEIPIDSKTVKRIRVEITPSVCEICAFDVAEYNGLGKWKDVPEYKHQDIIHALQEHKKVAHPVKEDMIVYEDEVPSVWLGNNNTL